MRPTLATLSALLRIALLLFILSSGKPTTSACVTALKRVAATCATSFAQKTWTKVAGEGEGNSVVQNAGPVTAIWTRLLADLERASEPIAKLMTDNVRGSPC